MREFKSFYKQVGGNEGEKCYYQTRLDTYGCGCQHDCKYCYAKSLLSFRHMWNTREPSVADIEKVRRKVRKIPSGSIVRLGGMTDCFQPIERQQRVTFETIKALNEQGVGYLIVTKSAMVADDEYMRVMDKNLAHIQITVTTLDDKLAATYEKASRPSDRVAAVLKLQEAGFDVAIRLSPLIEQFMDFDKLNGLGIDKAVVEFLRVNTWVERWFDIDYTPFTLKQSGYRHMQLEDKMRILDMVHIPSVTVCEDVTEHYVFWRDHFNPNPHDCCNLRKEN